MNPNKKNSQDIELNKNIRTFGTNIALDLSALLTRDDIGAYSFQPATQLKSLGGFFGKQLTSVLCTNRF